MQFRIVMFLRGARKPEILEETNADTGRTCETPHKKWVELTIKLWNLKLWGTLLSAALLCHSWENCNVTFFFTWFTAEWCNIGFGHHLAESKLDLWKYYFNTFICDNLFFYFFILPQAMVKTTGAKDCPPLTLHYNYLMVSMVKALA